MPLKFATSRCADERHHFSIDNEGVMHLDESVHDIDLEMSLVEMGGKAPECLVIYRYWNNHPFYFIQEHIGKRFVQTRDHQTGLILGLGVDFAYRVTALMDIIGGCSARNGLKYGHEVVLQALKLARPGRAVENSYEVRKALLSSISELNKDVVVRFVDESNAQMLAYEAGEEALHGVLAWDTNGADNARIQSVAAVAAAAIGPDYVSQEFDLQERMQRPPLKAVVDYEEAWQRRRTAYVLRYYRKHKIYPKLMKLPRFEGIFRQLGVVG